MNTFKGQPEHGGAVEAAGRARLAWESSRRVPQLGEESPWGIIEVITQHAPGVAFVSTSSHGGFFVDARESRIPLSLRLWAEKWSQGWGCEWFEEDCCGHAVVFHYAGEIAAELTRAGVPDIESGQLRERARVALKDLGQVG